jgi:hypothetical protein
MSFFVNSGDSIKVNITPDKDDNFWPITLRISAKDDFPYISFFMHHAELMEIVSSFQSAFEGYIEQYKETSNG